MGSCPRVEWMFEIKEAVQPKKEIRDKKSLSTGNGISNIYIYI